MDLHSLCRHVATIYLIHSSFPVPLSHLVSKTSLICLCRPHAVLLETAPKPEAQEFLHHCLLNSSLLLSPKHSQLLPSVF